MIENMAYLGEYSMVMNQAMQKTTRQIVCMALVLLMVFASTPGSAADQQKGGSFSVDTSIEGGWFFPPTAGQGFLFDLIEGDLS